MAAAVANTAGEDTSISKSEINVVVEGEDEEQQQHYATTEHEDTYHRDPESTYDADDETDVDMQHDEELQARMNALGVVKNLLGESSEAVSLGQKRLRLEEPATTHNSAMVVSEFRNSKRPRTHAIKIFGQYLSPGAPVTRPSSVAVSSGVDQQRAVSQIASSSKVDGGKYVASQPSPAQTLVNVLDQGLTDAQRMPSKVNPGQMSSAAPSRTAQRPGRPARGPDQRFTSYNNFQLQADRERYKHDHDLQSLRDDPEAFAEAERQRKQTPRYRRMQAIAAKRRRRKALNLPLDAVLPRGVRRRTGLPGFVLPVDDAPPTTTLGLRGTSSWVTHPSRSAVDLGTGSRHCTRTRTLA